MQRILSLLTLALAAGVGLSTGPQVRAGSPKVGVGPSFKGPIGLQLYSLRDQFQKDVPGTLALARSFGFTYVELAGTYGQSPEQFKTLLEQNGLKAVAGHFAYEQYRDDPEAIARQANAMGLKYAGCAWIPHQGDFDEKTCREAIQVFNHAGAVLAQHGLKFFYHVHGFEFQPYGSGTLLDLLMTETKPQFVNFEMDIFWIVFPGQDPVRLLEKYGKRWQLMHLKDMKRGLQTGALTGGTDVRNDVPLGQGQIDLPSLLRAAKRVGLKYYFIEDEAPTSVEQIPQSLRYLESVRF